MDGHEIINALRIGLNVLVFVVMPLTTVVVGIVATEIVKVAKNK